MQTYPSGGAAAPYEPGPAAVHMQQVHIQQTEVEHDTETGGFRVFMRSINVFHMVTHYHNWHA